MSLAIVSHFSQPEWAIVNKINAIAKCSELQYIHTSTAEEFFEKVTAQAGWQKVLVVSDENNISLLKTIEKENAESDIDCLLFLDSDVRDVAKEVASIKSVKYLIGSKSYELIGKDLAILIKKVSQGELMTVEKYLSYGAQISKRVISDHESKAKVIDEIYNYIDRLGDDSYSSPFSEYARRITEAVDELVLNAVFSSTEKGKEMDRSIGFSLDENQTVDVCWGFDGDYFGVGVTDRIGNFSKETILSYIDSNRKIGNIPYLTSGGLGVKMAFDRSHQFIVNVEPGKSTEVICLMKLENRLKKFDETKNSMFYFRKD